MTITPTREGREPEDPEQLDEQGTQQYRRVVGMVLDQRQTKTKLKKTHHTCFTQVQIFHGVIEPRGRPPSMYTFEFVYNKCIH